MVSNYSGRSMPRAAMPTYGAAQSTQPTQAQNVQSADIAQRINEILGYSLQAAPGMSAGLTAALNRGADPVVRQTLDQQYRTRLGEIGGRSQGSSAAAQRSVAEAQYAANLGQARESSRSQAMRDWGGYSQALMGLSGAIPQVDYAPGTSEAQAAELNRILGIQDQTAMPSGLSPRDQQAYQYRQQQAARQQEIYGR